MTSKAKFNPAKMEVITPPCDRPGTKFNISTYIAQTKELFIKNNKASFHKGIRIYMDGSGYKGTIGATAILYTNGIKLGESSYQLGSEVKHNVFEGKLTAILLGLQLAQKITLRQSKVTFNINNQATIKTMAAGKSQSAQYLINKIKHDIARLQEEEITNWSG